MVSFVLVYLKHTLLSHKKNKKKKRKYNLYLTHTTNDKKKSKALFFLSRSAVNYPQQEENIPTLHITLAAIYKI
jgi:hypothetical protein